MRTEQLTTGRLRIYSPDAIPLWALSSKRALTHIGKTFGFEQLQPAQPDDKGHPPGWAFSRGRPPGTESSAPATIESLTIGHGHLDLQTRDFAGHQFNDAVLHELDRVGVEVAPEHGGWINKHRLEILQTVWVGHLELATEELIDPRVREALIPALSKIGSEKGAWQVYPRGLNLRIVTQTARPDLSELGLQLPDEEFKLEPRAGRLASERTWYSTSTLRSEDHLCLLEAIERAYRS
jgi:hypothetical protein